MWSAPLDSERSPGRDGRPPRARLSGATRPPEEVSAAGPVERPTAGPAVRQSGDSAADYLWHARRSGIGPRPPNAVRASIEAILPVTLPGCVPRPATEGPHGALHRSTDGLLSIGGSVGVDRPRGVGPHRERSISRASCQGRSKSGPLAPVEKWTTLGGEKRYGDKRLTSGARSGALVVSDGTGRLLDRRSGDDGGTRRRIEFLVEMTLAPFRNTSGWKFTAFLQDLAGRREGESEREQLVEAARGGCWRLLMDAGPGT